MPGHSPVTFTSFPKLPVEIRTQIWQGVLPTLPNGRLLYFFEPGCWDEEWDEDGLDGPRDTDSSYRRVVLDPIDFEVPLFFVCRETRQLAVDWLRKNGIQTHFHSDKETFAFTRGYNPCEDVLYIPAEAFMEFYDESSERMCGQNGMNDSPVQRIAIPREMFEYGEEGHMLTNICRYHWDLTELQIVTGTPPTLGQQKARWTSYDSEAAYYTWLDGSNKFKLKGGARFGGNSSLHGEMRDFIVDMARELEMQGTGEFTIRTTVATRY